MVIYGVFANMQNMSCNCAFLQHTLISHICQTTFGRGCSFTCFYYFFRFTFFFLVMDCFQKLLKPFIDILSCILRTVEILRLEVIIRAILYSIKQKKYFFLYYFINQILNGFLERCHNL